MQPIETGRARWREYEIAYEVYGRSEGMPFLLMHGILLDSVINHDLAREFAEIGFRVVLCDFLGHGASDKPADPKLHRVDFYGEQALAVLDHLGIQRAVVGGISLGAITALELAVKAPQRVRALFLEMPVMEWSAPAAAMILVPPMMIVRYAAVLYRPIARFLRRLPRPRTRWLTSVLNAASQEPEVIAAILHGVMIGPVVPPAYVRRRIDSPTLIIGHGGDILHQLVDSEELAREIPGAKLLSARSILELRTKPRRLMPEILDFLGALPA